MIYGFTECSRTVQSLKDFSEHLEQSHWIPVCGKLFQNQQGLQKLWRGHNLLWKDGWANRYTQNSVVRGERGGGYKNMAKSWLVTTENNKGGCQCNRTALTAMLFP